MKYEVVESKVYKHPSGKTASIYGAHPHHGAGDGGWKIVVNGWTVYDTRSNTYGCGRPPWKTKEEAQAFCDKWNK